MLVDRKDKLRVLMPEGKPGRLRAVPKPSTSRNLGVQAKLLLWTVRKEYTFLYSFHSLCSWNATASFLLGKL